MIKAADNGNIREIAQLATELWEHHTVEEMEEEFSEILQDDSAQIFIKYEKQEAIGFAYCKLRYDYVEGTDSSPVGYLEGIFVEEAFRHKGYAKELLAACEEWAKTKGCAEFASDCEITNEDSYRFHMAMHFTEANRIICFTKKL